ncbi:hypothetical protein BDV32DRAFT_122061 [Aspergillus pseudonomiae]|uniref:Uncharacterized protein n=1 Tax=Aspergillus pseudonomiae TaxID=1506151 RepID=A0A5N6I3R8_9EURO|nr:uncharacterized protein BDV37DRAFT_135181 [Aspergillus pseudonomiae]KAB8261048.1 hypothetical protein BDV32DRAFT_122061 [Aspergillus pseudonomiae]KAE8403464.1 hypothetical protein BDV37DRAFT_135181 [Aspergillus pseudonomiae]
MPHKHKRKQNDADIYDLPPTMIAKALPVRDPNSKNKKAKKNVKDNKPQDKLQARRKAAADDDTPKAFRRLMQFQTQGKQAPSKPSAGENKKRKRGAENTENATQTTRKKAAPAVAVEQSTDAEPQVKPKILPGEKLSDFAARVDREMPIAGMKRSGKPTKSDIADIREHKVTKHEKHLLRLQSQWRKEEAEIQEREAAEREEREAELEDQLELWKEWEVEAGQGKAKKKGAGARKKGGQGADRSDPWAKLKSKDRLNKPANPFEIAEAPPQLTKPREIFKVRGGARVDVANVPTAVGSLRKREELANERRTIVEEYRRLMAEKRR